MSEDKVACRTPNPDKPGVTNIARWKYETVRRYIFEMVRDAGPGGMKYQAMTPELKKRMTAEEAKKLGNAGWYLVTVKLNMEVEGELRRLDQKGPQVVVLT